VDFYGKKTGFVGRTGPALFSKVTLLSPPEVFCGPEIIWATPQKGQLFFKEKLPCAKCKILATRLKDSTPPPNDSKNVATTPRYRNGASHDSI